MNKCINIALLLLLLAGTARAQEQGPFCGIVGTEGCTAVAANDPRVIAWATGCTVVRGPQDIAIDSSPLASFGSEEEALGVAWTNGTYGVLCLGDGGYATLTFDEPIANVEGYDFAVFENSFGDTFLELAFVEVSSDGINFVRFPATSLTPTNVQVGTYGSVDATYIDNLAGKYKGGYGTPFDLEQLRDSANLDINAVTHVRVVDVIGTIDPQYATYDAHGNIVNDPYPTNFNTGGFDLDGVAVLNPANSLRQAGNVVARLYPNPAANQVHISLNSQSPVEIALYDPSGRRLLSHTAQGTEATLYLSSLPNGIYCLKADGCCRKLVIQH